VEFSPGGGGSGRSPGFFHVMNEKRGKKPRSVGKIIGWVRGQKERGRGGPGIEKVENHPLSRSKPPK